MMKVVHNWPKAITPHLYHMPCTWQINCKITHPEITMAWFQWPNFPRPTEYQKWHICIQIPCLNPCYWNASRNKIHKWNEKDADCGYTYYTYAHNHHTRCTTHFVFASGHLSPRFHVIFNDQFDSVWDGSLDKKLRWMAGLWEKSPVPCIETAENHLQPEAIGQGM